MGDVERLHCAGTAGVDQGVGGELAIWAKYRHSARPLDLSNTELCTIPPEESHAGMSCHVQQ